MIYEPQEDSFFLLSFLKDYCKGNILEIGCGSGILMEEALKYTKDVSGVDIDAVSVKHCKDRGLRVIQSDLFDKVKGSYDFIIFNPPYLPFDSREDSESAVATTGGFKGNELVLRFLEEVKIYLNKGGKILMLVSSLTPNFEEDLKDKGFKFKKLGVKKEFYEELKVYLVSLK